MPSQGSITPQGNNPNSATATRRKDGGYNFTDAQGRPISAAVYAKAKGISFRELLSTMAKGGDKGAKIALGFVGDDFGYDPRKVGNNASLYNSLVWGTGRNALPFQQAFNSGGLTLGNKGSNTGLISNGRAFSF